MLRYLSAIGERRSAILPRFHINLASASQCTRDH